jgi:hypothetical protein
MPSKARILTLALSTVTAENPTKSTYKSVQELVNTLRKLQYGITPALQTIEFLHNKIVTACQGSPACRYAVSDPPVELAALINKSQSLILTYKKEQTATKTFFTDRRYHRRPDRQDRFRGRPTHNHRRGVCFIYKKEGCRS